jgi:hypothetical protein
MFDSPSPVPAEFSFAGAPAPAPAGGLFSSTGFGNLTPAPAFGSSTPTGCHFGSNTSGSPTSGFDATPAPVTGFGYGAPAPAPAGGSLFATGPAPIRAPAPSGELFGPPGPALAPLSFIGLGSNTSGLNLFGSTAPAPAPFGGFGSVPALVPFGQSGGFGLTTPPPTGHNPYVIQQPPPAM